MGGARWHCWVATSQYPGPMLFDDLGHPVPLAAPARRIVSLVPSITEAVAESLPGALVGATDYCTYPAALDVVRIKGTKNPDRAAIGRLQPDLVIANEEENRADDIARLRADGLAVWVTKIDSLDEAITGLERLFGQACAVQPSWLDDARAIWSVPPRLEATVLVPIWAKPWMWLGCGTYASDVLARLGLRNVVDQPRYPRRGPGPELAADIILRPDEPHDFTGMSLPEPLAGSRAVDVPGRALFWYGPAMVAARAELELLVAE